MARPWITTSKSRDSAQRHDVPESVPGPTCLVNTLCQLTGIHIPVFIISTRRVLWHILSYHIIYHIISYHIIAYHIISYHIISHHITSHHITSHHITSRHVTSRHVTPRHATSRHVTSRHVTSRHLISYHIISYHIISYHFISYHIISYHRLPFIAIGLYMAYVSIYMPTVDMCTMKRCKRQGLLCCEYSSVYTFQNWHTEKGQ